MGARHPIVCLCLVTSQLEGALTLTLSYISPPEHPGSEASPTLISVSRWFCVLIVLSLCTAVYCGVLWCTVVYSLGELTRDFLQVKPSELSECREDLWWLGHQNSQLFCDKNVPPVVLFDPSALHCACCYCSVTAGCWVVLIQYKLHSLTPWTSHLTPHTSHLTP